MGAQGKEIIELENASSLGVGDMLLVRKTSEGADKKATFQVLQESLGNSGVDGYTATEDATQDNSIILTPSNNATILKYYDAMKVSFISPVASDGQVFIKIGSLEYKKLYGYKSASTAVVAQKDYIEAVYVQADDRFYQVNNIANIYTNDYIIETHEYMQGDVATNIYLTSAYGARKQAYYKGMTINFLCTIDTKGFVRVNIDGLGVKDIVDGDVDDLIYTPLYKGLIVQAVYDGTSFIHNQYRVQDPAVEYSVAADRYSITEEVNAETGLTEVVVEEIPPPQMQFEYTVGTTTGCKFETLPKAIDACIKEFGKDGGGRKVTLKVMSDLDLEKNSIYIDVHSGKYIDLRWITLSGNNNIIKITGNSNNAQALINGADLSYKSGTKFDATSVQQPQHQITIMIPTKYCELDGVEFLGISTNGYCIYFSSYLEKAIIKNCKFVGTDVGILSQSGSVTVDNCTFNGIARYAYYVSGKNAYVEINNSDLSKSGTAEITNIQIYGTNHLVLQKYSKGKSNVQPNATTQYGSKYQVIGSQDKVGQ